MNDNEIVKKYLATTPADDSLPKDWDYRFGRRGRFMKYSSVAHCEQKNMITRRDDDGGGTLPFGYGNESWERFKSNLRPEDELWIWGNDSMSILHVRDNEIIDEHWIWIV